MGCTKVLKDVLKDCNDEITCSLCDEVMGYYNAKWVDGSFEAVCYFCKHPEIEQRG